MKKDFLTQKLSMLKTLVGIGCLFCSIPWAYSSPLLDRKYQLKQVGALLAWDNIDNIFENYVEEAFSQFFKKQSRFIFKSLKRPSQILKQSNIPYLKLIEDKGILKELSKTTHIRNLIRTRVSREMLRYKITYEWIHAPKIEILAKHSFYFNPEEKKGSFQTKKLIHTLKQGLQALIQKLPFLGQITGKEKNWITIDLGKDTLQKGDMVVLSSLERVKRHPLLKELVEWKFTPTGQARIEKIDEKIAFAKIIEEEKANQILKYQKITRILRTPKKTLPPSSSFPTLKVSTRPPSTRPTLGWMSASPWIGTFSREMSTLNGTSGKTGSGLLFGALMKGELWWTRFIISQAMLGFGFSSYSQKQIDTGTNTNVGSVSTSLLTFRAQVAYSYLFTQSFFGPKLLLGGGWKIHQYQLPASTTEQTDPISFSSIFLTLGSHFPLSHTLKVNASFDLGLLRSSSRTQKATSSSDLSFFLSANYRVASNLFLSVGFHFAAQSADFIDNITISHRIISVLPSIQYTF